MNTDFSDAGDDILIEFKEFNIKEKGGIGWDQSWNATGTVCVIWGAREFGTLPFAHLGHTLVPRWNMTTNIHVCFKKQRYTNTMYMYTYSTNYDFVTIWVAGTCVLPWLDAIKIAIDLFRNKSLP